MNIETFLGSWYIYPEYATRLQEIIIPRLRAGFDPVPTSFKKSLELPLTDQNGDFDFIAHTLNKALKLGGGEVAVLPLNGAMSRFGFCGSGGNEFLAQLIERANLEPQVKSVVISAHTPGGTVDSTEMVANAIRDSRKKVVGYVNGLCASAGVFALSQAHEVVMENSVSAEIGSIGVLMVYMNQKKAMENEGYAVEIFRADGSEDKARLNAYEPLTEELRAEIQQDLNDARKAFVGYVRRGRAGRLKSDEVFSAKMYRGKQALSLGLVDRLGTLSDAIKAAKKS